MTKPSAVGDLFFTGICPSTTPQVSTDGEKFFVILPVFRREVSKKAKTPWDRGERELVGQNRKKGTAQI
jgi:hypothetical protein